MESPIQLDGRDKVVQYKNNVVEKPLVSVSVVTYKHEQYIKQCLDGILMQKTNFEFEILLGEDDSPDQTREICIEYADRFPNKIRLFLHDRSNVIYINDIPTGRYNMLFNLQQARGRYIALCEGDDYWTDPLKLQKQVDFLEANKGYSMVAHDVKLIFEDVKEKYPFQIRWKKNTFTFTDEFNHHFIPTLSVLFRRKNLYKLPKGFEKLIVGDIPLFLYILSQGKGWYIQEKMGVKRRNSGGITQNKARKQKLLEGMYLVWVYIKRFTPKKLISDLNVRLAGYERAMFKKKIKSMNIFAFKYLYKSIIHCPKWYLKILFKPK